MRIDLSDTVAVVTGASGDMGRAICAELSSSGAQVIATDLPERVEAARKLEARWDWASLDVTQESQWQDLTSQLGQRFGRLDILVHNAAVAPVIAISDMSLDQWRQCQSVNVDGIFLGLKSAAVLLGQSGSRRPGGASVVVMSSAGGIVAAPFNAAYCTSKAAVRHLTKAAAVEFSALGQKIRVNSVHPGCVEGEMMTGIIKNYVDLGAMSSLDEATQAMNAAHVLGRMAQPQEVAAGVLFLASEASSFMHGSELVIDGGYIIR